MRDELGAITGTRVIRDLPALEAFEAEWTRLWALSAPPPPMLEFGWIRQWWQQHRAEGELLVVVSYDGGEPIGVAPLYVRSREANIGGVLRTVLFLGTGEPEFEEVCGENAGWLGPPTSRRGVTVAVADVLGQERSIWDRLSLRYMGPDLVPAEDLRQLLNPLLLETTLERSTNYRVQVESFDEYVARIPSASRRGRFRKLMRRGAEAGLELVVASDVTQARELLERLAHLHQSYWRERDEPGAFASAKFHTFHRSMLEQHWSAGRLWLYGLRRPDGRWVALHYNLQAGDILYYYLSGIDYDAASKLAPGTLILLHGIDLAARRGVRVFDLLAGAYDFKEQLANDSIETVTLDALAAKSIPRAWRGLRDLRRAVGASPPRPTGV